MIERRAHRRARDVQPFRQCDLAEPRARFQQVGADDGENAVCSSLCSRVGAIRRFELFCFMR